MQLSRLEIKGFKSFGDKITIHFNQGVTAIVGPNGCGKSNVVDAIRWVLGEQSTRMLRSEKMENIIFNGTKNRKPANLAEVSLTFDNTKNILPTAYSQVTITRKLYRSGESEYRLNDVQCRLKDITDLFLDTGIGPDSYAIIELKMIDEIITNKENSRRTLFEEASGISKYKLRKKQTFNKLRDTENDLTRVDDLLFEIEKNLKTLENQAKKAERYYRIKEEYKQLSITSASFKIEEYKILFNQLEEREQLQNIEKTTLLAALDKLEATIQQQKLDILQQEKNLSVQQKATNEFISKIRAYENDKKIKNEQLKFLEEKENKLTTELEKDKQQLNHVLYNIKRINEEKIIEEQQLNTLQHTLKNLTNELEELRLQQNSSKTELDELNKQNQALQNALYNLEKERDVLQIQKDTLNQEIERTSKDTDNKEIELTEFNKALENIDNTITNLNNQLTNDKNFENQLIDEIDNISTLLTQQKEEIVKNSRKLDAKQNEYNLTKSLVDNLEGFPESIRFLKKNQNWTKNALLLSDIFFCREEYRIPIENYLEPVMNHYVVETYSEAIKGINLLSDASKGRANFFIREHFKDLINDHSISSPTSTFLPAMQVIEVEPQYRLLCEYLLRNVYIIEENEEKELNTSDLPTDIVLLSKSGQFIKSRTSMTGGSVGLFEGKRIGRVKNLEILAKDIKQLEQLIGQLKVLTDEYVVKINQLKASTKQKNILINEQQLQQAINESISIQTRKDQYQSFIENSRNRKQDIENRITTITLELEELDPKISTLKSKKEQFLQQFSHKQQYYNELSDLVLTRSSAYNQENIRLHQQQNKLAGLEKDLEYREIQQDTLLKRTETNTQDVEQVKQEIKNVLEHVDTNDEDLIAMYLQKEEMEKGLTTLENDYQQTRHQVTTNETESNNLRRKKDAVEQLFNELKDKKNQLKLELNTLKERFSVEFNFDIQTLLETENLDLELNPEKLSISDLKSRTEKLKKQLDEYGSINPMAMEAYQEMNERYEFITTQKKDLLEAKNSLLDTIKEIDDTAKEQFINAFNQIRNNFVKVFRSLFNDEDSCDLVLIDDTNPLDSDIDIIARPKGKRPLSINQLSGGEKTLTATALLFSLYLLKPAPFCIFDEVDAPLDDTNIDKFNNIIQDFSKESQFIIVSHNKRTIASTDIIYGVTMVEQGVSRVVAVDIRDIAKE